MIRPLKVLLVLLLIFLTACSSGNDAEKPIAQIALTGSYRAGNYLFEIFPDARIQITIATLISYKKSAKKFKVESIETQQTIYVSEIQYDELLDAISNFSEDDAEDMKQLAEDPAPWFDVTVVFGKKYYKSDGNTYIINSTIQYYQGESIEKIYQLLSEISPVQITFVRAPY